MYPFDAMDPKRPAISILSLSKPVENLRLCRSVPKLPIEL